MGTQYAGDETLFPVDFTIPDDADPEDASSINVALEALGDRTKFNKQQLADYLALRSPRMRVIEFLTSGTYTPDAASRIVAAWATGCGGGGAGGTGINGTLTVNRWMCGGGGGGAALLGTIPLILVPGTTYNVDVGAGGISQIAQGGTGADGGDTVIRDGATVLAAFGGAQGGRGAIGGDSPSLWLTFALGGAPRAGMPSVIFGDPTKGMRFDTSDAMWVASSLQFRLAAGQGGFGCGGSTNPASSAGAPNPYGNFPGGAGGMQGTDSGTQRGGGGGGGGAAGPFGVGGAGGSGGNGGFSGGGGNSAADNTGAGGGGSGSGGYGNFGRGPSGAGGSGLCRLVIVEESP